MTMIGTLNFYTVQGWMVSELHLTGNELLAYAVIYGFSQDGASAFRGTLAYIAEWLGCSKSSAHRTLRRLTERGLIEVCGRLDVPGRPSLFRTTDVFLRTMGLRELSQLPPLPDMTNGEGIEKLQNAIDEIQNAAVSGQMSLSEVTEQNGE